MSSDVANMSILDRFAITAEFRRERVDVFIYTLREVEKMLASGNPLVLSALVEGIPVVTCDHIEELRSKASRMYKRHGRVWIRVD